MQSCVLIDDVDGDGANIGEGVHEFNFLFVVYVVCDVYGLCDLYLG